MATIPTTPTEFPNKFSCEIEHGILLKAVEGLDATLEYLRIIGCWHMEEAEEAVKTLRELLPSHLLDI